MSAYVNRCAVAVQRQDGGALAQCLQVFGGSVQAGSIFQIPEDFQPVISLHMSARSMVTTGNWSEGFQALVQCVTAFCKAIRTHTKWVLPALYQLARDLRVLAMKADAAAQNQLCLTTTGRILNSAFAAIQDRLSLQDTKKRGAVEVVNQMFKTYFKLNNYRLCKPLTKILQGPGYPSLQSYPRAHYVTFQYYVGRLHMVDGEYAEAESALQQSFLGCPQQVSFKNRRLALLYLVPVKMLNGKLPRLELLETYDVKEYTGIAQSIIQGNLALFDATFAQNEALFRLRGLYLLIQRLRMIVFRTLVKKTFRLFHQPKAPHVLPFNVLECAVGVSVKNNSMALGEIECIVANLIYQKYIKGYLAKKKDAKGTSVFLILSQKQPFPKLSGIY